MAPQITGWMEFPTRGLLLIQASGKDIKGYMTLKGAQLCLATMKMKKQNTTARISILAGCCV